MWAIIGLGNPGERYAGTRHNIGFDVVDLLAQRFGVRLHRGAHPFLMARAQHRGHPVLLVEPLTFVNRSGIAVRALQHDQPQVRDEDLLVLVDDVALPFGRLRLRGGGSAGGHNGLQSIEDTLGHRDWARLRLGVGAAAPGVDLADHVLSPFDREEVGALPGLVAAAADAVECVLQHGVEASLSRVNGRRPGSSPRPDEPEDGDAAEDPADPGAR